MVEGMVPRPNRATYKVIKMSPTPKARVPAVLKMDIASPSFEPAYRETIHVKGIKQGRPP